ncbi:MAG: sulfatase-like hydrolase/transferase, partial [Calditrichia bacterium]
MSKDFRKKALHIFALNGLALAQPFFNTLVLNPTFLVAHHIGPVDLILLTVVLMGVLPCLFITILYLSGCVNKQLSAGMFIFIFVILSSLIALPVTREIPSYTGSHKVFLALVIGLTAYGVYRRYHPARLFLSYLGPLVLFLPINFLFNTDTTKLLFPYTHENPYPASKIKGEHKVPIFLVVLDEFPITSLMDETGMIDSVRYPNFHNLSRNSNWFRNAITVSEWTDVAVPAILTGRYPSRDRPQIPMLEDYPDNLFTLLEPHYEFEVFEEVTYLCSIEKCGNPQLSELPVRTLQIYSDLTILFCHSVLPADFSLWLPPIQNRWKNFREIRGEKNRVYDERLNQFENFIESISSKNKSTLYFLHLALPHTPFIYFPSGKTYTELHHMIAGRSSSKDSWTSDHWLVAQAYQRHLLQVGYTDKLIGRLIQTMKASGIYDEALLIVTADHGISFLPGERARGYTQFNYPDILSIPLF